MRGRCAAPLHAVRWRAHRYSVTAAALIGFLAVACVSAHVPQSHEVEMTAFAFSPDTLRVAAGDTVVWSNRDVVPHTATAAGGTWDSGVIPAQGRWSLLAETPGELEYVCTLHPSMTGVIVVE